MKRLFFLFSLFILTAGMVSACSPASAVSNTPTSPAPSQQFVITASDNGKTFTYTVTSRFTVELDQNKYPKENLSCEPTGIVGSISNIPAVEPPLYAARFEAVKAGTCTLKDDGFEVTIRVVE